MLSICYIIGVTYVNRRCCKTSANVRNSIPRCNTTKHIITGRCRCLCSAVLIKKCSMRKKVEIKKKKRPSSLGSSGCDGMCNAFVKKFKKKDKKRIVLSKKRTIVCSTHQFGMHLRQDKVENCRSRENEIK